MELPLRPAYKYYVNIFICNLQTTYLDECPLEFKPVLYKRCIDDTFLLFKHQNHANLFLQYINSNHNSIKFSMEIEINNKLSSLESKPSKQFHSKIIPSSS